MRLSLILCIFLLAPGCKGETSSNNPHCRVDGRALYADGSEPVLLHLRKIDNGTHTVTASNGGANDERSVKVSGGGTVLEARFPALATGETHFRVDGTYCDHTLVQPGYAIVTTFPTLRGIEMRAVAIDTDGDGDQDIVASNGVSLTNDGNGNFREGRLFNDPVDRIATADFNGDGQTDLLLWNRRGGRSIAAGTVLLHAGATFTPNLALRNSILTGSYGEAMVDDLDGDGYTDAVTVSENGLWVRWNAAGVLSNPILLDAGNDRLKRGFAKDSNDYLSTIKILDVDEDGQKDIVYGRLSIARQTAPRTFAIDANLYSLSQECAALTSSSECPRIVDFLHLAKNETAALVRHGVNVPFHGTTEDNMVSSGFDDVFPGTWFGYGDIDGDDVPDRIGFREDDPQPTAYFSSLRMYPITPLLSRETAGNISAVLIDRFDKRQAAPQIVFVSGNQELTVVRYKAP